LIKLTDRISLFIRSGNITTYTVFVSDTNPTMKVEAVFTDMLEPYPAEITQNEV
jgi:uncharacterized beta-barrel protein YwiB (DUF1934 family)